MMNSYYRILLFVALSFSNLLTFSQNVADSTTQNVPLQIPLSASNYHHQRSGIKNAQIVFERTKKGRVAFLGGSITHNSGWRDSIAAYLEKRFPETTFDFINAGIPSMGTTPAAFRLERDVLSKGKIDILFEEAAVNDASNGRTATEQLRAMEGIVRNARAANPKVDIVMMHFVDPDKIKNYTNNNEPEVIANHNRVAVHYNIPTINLAKEVTDRIDNNEFTWEGDFRNLHPSPFGQGVYSRSIIHFLSNAFSTPTHPNEKTRPHRLPKKMDKFAFGRGHLLDVSKAKLGTGWNIEPIWNPNDNTGTRLNYVDVPMLISDTPGSTLKLKFEGTAVGIAVAAGKDAGHIEYRIDHNEWQIQNLFTQWSVNLHLPWYYTLASELAPIAHELEIRIVETKDYRSKGHACRIRYFYASK